MIVKNWTCNISRVCLIICSGTNISCQIFCNGLFPSQFGPRQASICVVRDTCPQVTPHCPQDFYCLSSSAAFNVLLCSVFPFPYAPSPLPSSSHLRFHAMSTLNYILCAFPLLGLRILSSSLWLEHSSFFSQPLFSFSLAICCSPLSLNLDRIAFRNHWLAAHPEEIPCPGVYRAPSTFPQTLVTLLTASWLAHFPSPLSCEDHKLRNYDLLPNCQWLEQGLVPSIHPINACSVIKQFIEWLQYMNDIMFIPFYFH